MFRYLATLGAAILLLTAGCRSPETVGAPGTEDQTVDWSQHLRLPETENGQAGLSSKAREIEGHLGVR